MLNVTVPSATNTLSDDLDKIRANFVWIRMSAMVSGIVPIDGVVVTPTYTGSDITELAFSGTLVGSAAFTYDGNGNLTDEVWTLYGVTITITHTYSGSTWQSSSVAVA